MRPATGAGPEEKFTRRGAGPICVHCAPTKLALPGPPPPKPENSGLGICLMPAIWLMPCRQISARNVLLASDFASRAASSIMRRVSRSSSSSSRRLGGFCGRSLACFSLVFCFFPFAGFCRLDLPFMLSFFHARVPQASINEQILFSLDDVVSSPEQTYQKLWLRFLTAGLRCDNSSLFAALLSAAVIYHRSQ